MPKKELKLKDGQTSPPAISFISDPETGLFIRTIRDVIRLAVEDIEEEKHVRSRLRPISTIR